MFSNPFAASTSIPGHGTITLAVLPPATPALQTLSYQYPLKLIAPAATTLPRHDLDHQLTLIYTIFLLTYGGGLVAGDTINLQVNLAQKTRLVLLTQGSTKIFKSPSGDITCAQLMTVNLADGSALCYLPDPVQPFEKSAFQQKQVYNMLGENGNLCVLDWVCEGRTARGEKWSFSTYASRNEVCTVTAAGRRRLMLRDNVVLDNDSIGSKSVLSRMHGLGVFGTLILCGQLFRGLSTSFIEEFKLLPRIGNRQWDARPGDERHTQEEIKRAARVEQEAKDQLLWSAAATRGFVVVKFGAKEVEGARRWLRHMLNAEGTIEREFGEKALLCLR